MPPSRRAHILFDCLNSSRQKHLAGDVFAKPKPHAKSSELSRLLPLAQYRPKNLANNILDTVTAIPPEWKAREAGHSSAPAFILE
jgi:hypothetical protein